jgi:hypothetical protein
MLGKRAAKMAVLPMGDISRIALQHVQEKRLPSGSENAK